MKFLARRSDGQILGRFADESLTFPIPNTAIVFDSPADISERQLPNGSPLRNFTPAKIQALIGLHPDFNDIFNMCEEFVDPDADLTLSQLITSGPGKTTVIRPGGTLIGDSIFHEGSVSVCVRFRAFVMGSPPGRTNVQYYNYQADEESGGFISPPSLQAALVDATDPGITLLSVVSDVESLPTVIPSFRMAFHNSNSFPVFMSDWTLISKSGGIGGGPVG